MAEQEGDEQPPNPAVAVGEWVDGFELGVCECAGDKRVRPIRIRAERARAGYT
jgi:hypothetical protein